MQRQIKFSRIVDLTVPIESNMPGIPGVPAYSQNPSKVEIVGIMNEAQRELVRREGMTLRDDVVITGRSMISVLSILVHNGTHIDAPRHMIEQGHPIDQVPLSGLVSDAILINLPHKGANSTISAQDILETGVDFGPDVVPFINTGWTEKMWGKPGFWEQMPYWEGDVGNLMADRGVTAVAMDVFPEKTIWRVPLAPGEIWVANHLALLGRGIAMIQFVTNLSQIGNDRFFMAALPLRIKGGDASPARVVALVD